jgi:hypothetical protein
VRTDSPGSTATAVAFTEAVNDGRHEDAAALLMEDVELAFPGATLRGRGAWLESRRRQQSPVHLREVVVIDRTSETPNGVEIAGRMIQRWAENGEVANETPVRIRFVVVDGMIERLELSPGADPHSDGPR